MTSKSYDQTFNHINFPSEFYAEFLSILNAQFISILADLTDVVPSNTELSSPLSFEIFLVTFFFFLSYNLLLSITNAIKKKAVGVVEFCAYQHI